MKLGARRFEETVRRLDRGGLGRIGNATPEVAHWLESLHELPPSFVSFMKTHSPKTEIWAGAGGIFDETAIMRWNREFPAPLQAGLFILGSAPNGDLIVLDLENSPGAVGYLNHERMYSVQDLRPIFVPICESLGEFLWRINANENDLPDDYFEALTLRK
jgi:hypothetical protein